MMGLQNSSIVLSLCGLSTSSSSGIFYNLSILLVILLFSALVAFLRFFRVLSISVSRGSSSASDFL